MGSFAEDLMGAIAAIDKANAVMDNSIRIAIKQVAPLRDSGTWFESKEEASRLIEKLLAAALAQNRICASLAARAVDDRDTIDALKKRIEVIENRSR